MKRICVIVESPAKCKKIESYLGSEYKCIASYGHLRELKSLQQIENFETFVPKFSNIQEEMKLKQIETLRTEISRSKEVILATDDDREGEAIAWHICQLFDLNIETTKRIVFHEITETSIKHAVSNPKTINMNIVNAQQARQMLDLLVGFNITPLLWKYISKQHVKSLSAGRCQTPTLQLVYDNYMDIKNQNTQLMHHITGYFTRFIIPFELNKSFESEEEVEDFLENSLDHEHVITVSDPKQSISAPPEPLITSSLQQLCSNELHFSPKDTMKYAQQLYENGYITYMRTDCKTYAQEFIQHSKEFILREYNDKKYINDQMDKDSKNGNGNGKTQILTQEAHEAIRPVSLFVKVSDLKDKVDSKAIKLYDVIWRRTLESCMSNSTAYYIIAKITTSTSYFFQYKSEQIHFLGWKIVSKKVEDNKLYHYLKTIKQESIVEYTKIVSTASLKNVKSHFTEARLIHLLEENGIGRPSTFATLIDKIQERGYVSKENIKGKTILCKEFVLEGDELTESEQQKIFGNENNKLVIQPLGILVIEFLKTHFHDLFQYDYTKQMEDELDLISQGKNEYSRVCKTCNEQIQDLISKLSNDDTTTVINKYEIKIDNLHSYIIGKYGPIIKKTEGKKVTFLKVKKDVDIKRLENGEYKIEDLLEDSSINEKCIGKFNGEDLIIKNGKYGMYASWGTNKKSLQECGNKPIDSLQYIEIIRILEKDTLLNPDCPLKMIRKITDEISIRNGKHGDYIFYKNKKMKKPQFLKLNGFPGDYKTANINIFLEWIKTTYKIVI